MEFDELDGERVNVNSLEVGDVVIYYHKIGKVITTSNPGAYPIVIEFDEEQPGWRLVGIPNNRKVIGFEKLSTLHVIKLNKCEDYDLEISI